MQPALGVLLLRILGLVYNHAGAKSLQEIWLELDIVGGLVYFRGGGNGTSCDSYLLIQNIEEILGKGN